MHVCWSQAQFQDGDGRVTPMIIFGELCSIVQTYCTWTANTAGIEAPLHALEAMAMANRLVEVCPTNTKFEACTFAWSFDDMDVAAVVCEARVFRSFGSAGRKK